ncbi:cation:proton antiporter [Algicella marina]|uniref:Sodium:proton antiporter n=1 Tax=Algicella marina TaxID=2683284 RepID=A0A6P1SXA3_9RHOB|nr:sodium:proton antiporter [Algicella marina]QHQ35304.1 sodium:proton antiporter [Algicella marina]
MESAPLFALIGGLGIGSQWLAWRLQIPAIVMMLFAGVLAGPVFGLVDPEAAFGDLFRPMVSIAVAVILFEGGLTLNFSQLRTTGLAVRRLVIFGAPLAWAFSTLAARYAGGLSWESATVLGGILIVTGPTVIIPLLRQARLAPRPASLLRWEAIVNDPVGALAAVLAFEVITAVYGAGTLGEAAKHLALGISVAAVAGYAGGWVLAQGFRRGMVPEYMKVPVLFGMVLAVYASTDSLLHESGLLAVTIMGVYLANAHLPSLDEIRRFKEHVTVILVSGVFILLAANLDVAMITGLTYKAALFVIAIVFVARPLAVWLSLSGTGLSREEKVITAWIGPRGVVAVAVAGLFGTRLEQLGIADGAQLAPLAFVLVTATVILHGFSIVPLSRLLGLTSTEKPGVLIVGSSPWAVQLGEALKAAEIPSLIADRNWFRLRAARQSDIRVYHGEILSEAAEHTVDMNRYGLLLAASDNDAYNALVCTDFAPEFGRGNVVQIGRHTDGENERDLPVTLGGRSIGKGKTYGEIESAVRDGWSFRVTALSEEYTLKTYMEDRPEADVWAIVRKSGSLEIVRGKEEFRAQAGDSIIALVPQKARKEEPPEAGEGQGG